jgi:hypothetical protein
MTLFRAVEAGLSFCLNGKMSMVNLLEIAKIIARQRGIKIDRVARRTREGIMCWFCENAPELACGRLLDSYFWHRVAPPAYANMVITGADVPRNPGPIGASGDRMGMGQPTTDDIFHFAGEQATTDEENENTDNWQLSL